MQFELIIDPNNIIKLLTDNIFLNLQFLLVVCVFLAVAS